jgi:hypothetical protein
MDLRRAVSRREIAILTVAVLLGIGSRACVPLYEDWQFLHTARLVWEAQQRPPAPAVQEMRK